MAVSSSLPLVTVVTPSYNQGRFIRESIESVLAQDYPRIEYLVMDGGSTDETRDILHSYGQRFEWVSEPDRGQAHAINKGWRRGAGDILAWLNSDDVWFPGAVSRAVRHLCAHPECGMVHGQAQLVDAAGRFLRPYPTKAFNAALFQEECTVCQPTAFIRRTAAMYVGELNESLRYCMDYEYWIRLSRHAVISTLPDLMAKSRWHDDCKTVRERVAAQEEGLEMLYAQYGSVRLRPLAFAAREFARAGMGQSSWARWGAGTVESGLQFIRAWWRYNRRCEWRELARVGARLRGRD